jgi:hypothetical protein
MWITAVYAQSVSGASVVRGIDGYKNVSESLPSVGWVSVENGEGYRSSFHVR